jgi:hypothetical protein
MAHERDDLRTLSADELEAVSGGAAIRFAAFSQQSFLASRLDWVALNPQPLPPRWLQTF